MKPKRLYDLILNNVVVVFTLLLVIWCHWHYPQFRKNAPVDILKRTAAYLIMPLGVGGVMLLGGTDLSAGRIMGFTAIVSTSLLQKLTAPTRMFTNLTFDIPISVVLPAVLAVGGLIGLFVGAIVGKLKLKSWLVTLCVQMMMYGIMLAYMSLGTNKGSSVSNLRADYKNFIAGNLIHIGSWQIPNYVWYIIIVTFIVWFIWNKTKLGHEMRFVGENRQAAEISGVNVNRVIIGAFVMAGMLYAFNGFVEAARAGGSGGSCGNGAECDAITACLIGGVSLRGGRGRISGIVFGTIVLQLISVCFQWMSVSANYVTIIKGAIMLVAAACDMRRYWRVEQPQEIL